MKQEEAKRVIDLVEAVKNYIQEVEESRTPQNRDLVDLGNREYKIGHVPVKYLGGINYIVGFDEGVKVKAFNDGTYRLSDDLYFDSEGNPIEK